jgi:Concanavalin A-like lectin/glucanases superfamily
MKKIISLLFVCVLFYNCTQTKNDIVCQNAGIVKNGICICPSGFTGPYCETSINSGSGAGDTINFSVNGATFSKGTITNIKYNQAYVTTSIGSLVGVSLSNYGHCWSKTNQTPTRADNSNTNGIMNAPTSYNTLMQSLLPNTTYYVRAWIEIAGTTYYHSKAVAFTTSPPALPIFGSSTISNTLINTSTLNGSIADIGSYSISDYGFCWSKFSSPTNVDAHTSKGAISTAITFNDNISNLDEYSTYYIRPYCISNGVTSYGTQENLKTEHHIPVFKGLLCYYNFNDQLATDSVNGYNGVINGSLSMNSNTPDGMGYSGSFNSNTAYINIPFSITASDYTYSLWIKTNSTEGGIMTIPGYDNCLAFGNNSGIKLFYERGFIGNYGDGFSNDISTTLLDNNWHHLTVIFSQTNNFIKYYIDGVLQESFANNTWGFNNQSNMHIGGTGTGLGGLGIGISYIGNIDNYRIYNRELSLNEIQKLFQLKK